MTLPITTPCAHNFCKACLEGAFAGKSLVRERSRGGRTLRSQKNVLQCPSCPTDISEFLQNPQVNRELMDVIESLKTKTEEGAGPAEDSSDEEEDPNMTSEKTESAEKAGEKDDGELERACKRKKVEENKVSEKPGCSDGDSEVKEAELGNPEGGKEDLEVAEAETKSRKNKVTVVEGHSPSSTLQIQSSDEDFE